METTWEAHVAIGDRDERERVRAWLDADPQLLVRGTYADADAATEALRRGPSALLVLDADLPGASALDWVRQRPRRTLPVLVLVSAERAGAELAFDLEAVDFLRRPLDPGRFALARDRAKRAIRLRLLDTREADADPDGPVGRDRHGNGHGHGHGHGNGHDRPPVPQGRTNGHLRRFVIREVGRIFFVDVDRVDWMRSAGNYLELHTSDGTHLMRESLVTLERRLDPDRFVRISRSAMVNLECVRELKPAARGGYRVLLRDGTVLKLSRRYRDRLEATL